MARSDVESVDGRPSLVDGAEQAVRRWLRPGRFREGDRLPTEEQLAAMLGVSRGTLRGALGRLERSGEIVRRQGSGTFVGRLPVSHSEISWLRADSYVARPYGGPLEVRALSFEQGPADDRACAVLMIAPGAVTLQIRRVFAAGGRPIATRHDVLHPELALPAIAEMRAWLADAGSIHAMLVAKAGLRVTLRRTRIASRLVTPAEPIAELLALRADAACLTMEEVSLDGGRALHVARDVIVPGEVEIEVTQAAGGERLGPVLERDA